VMDKTEGGKPNPGGEHGPQAVDRPREAPVAGGRRRRRPPERRSAGSRAYSNDRSSATPGTSFTAGGASLSGRRSGASGRRTAQWAR
jgi:hypothetical protein